MRAALAAPREARGRQASKYAPRVYVVRSAVEADVEVLSGMLARAFFSDPVATYLFPDDEKRVRQLGRFFALQLRRIYLSHGVVETTATLSGAALWFPVGGHLRSRRDLGLGFAFARLLGRRLLPTRQLVQLLGSHHPTTGHYYLGTLATEPAEQRRGIGSSLLRGMLRRCDEERHPAYLECSKAENVSFYESHGFEVATEVVAPGGGPRLWLMWREPAPSRSSS